MAWLQIPRPKLPIAGHTIRTLLPDLGRLVWAFCRDRLPKIFTFSLKKTEPVPLLPLPKLPRRNPMGQTCWLNIQMQEADRFLTDEALLCRMKSLVRMGQATLTYQFPQLAFCCLSIRSHAMHKGEDDQTRECLQRLDDLFIRVTSSGRPFWHVVDWWLAGIINDPSPARGRNVASGRLGAFAGRNAHDRFRRNEPVQLGWPMEVGAINNLPIFRADTEFHGESKAEQQAKRFRKTSLAN